MANYVKATNFTAKDSLPTGNPSKVVKGVEIDTELSAVANAIASKADINSPNLTGTPTASTATAGSNTTQLATTAFVTGALTTSLTAAATLTNKTVNLTNNTLTGTLAQFNTACSNADFASIAGAETLTNKTLTSPSVTGGSFSSPALTGTPTAPTAAAATNTTQIATTAHVFAERTNTATLTNKTLTSPTINTATISGGSITGITDLAVADGGTGRSTLAANAVLIGNGTAGINSVAPSTSGNVLTSNGTSWTSSSSSLFGSGQTWQSVTRTAGTTYTNSTGKAIGVFVGGSTNTGAENGGYAAITVNGILLRGSWAYTGSVPASMLAIVAPGSTYKYETFFLNSVVFYEFR